jgi:hypothetical protein
MYINNYFNTTIWSEQKPEFLKSLTKATNKYIKAAKNFPEAKKHIKEFGDFGRSHIIQHLLQRIMILEILEIILVKSLGNI